MLAKMIEKIENMANAKERCKVELVELDGINYIHQGDDLARCRVPAIETIETRSLTSLVEMIRSFLNVELNHLQVKYPLIIKANGNDITVVSSVDHTYGRQYLFRCTPIIPRLILDRYVPAEQMIININTCYENDAQAKAFIDNISKVYNIQSVEMVDNGVGSQLKVTQGSKLEETVVIDPIIQLTPIQTYPEIPQISRQFNLRVNRDGDVALFVCDTGIFERLVQDELAIFFKKELKEEIDAGNIVLAM